VRKNRRLNQNELPFAPLSNS